MPISPQITITPEDISFKSFDITAVTYTSSTATYTATGHTLSAGNIVTITGLAPDGYNGTYTISTIATNTFTVANTTNTALTDQAGNVYWADATEYEYTGGQTVSYFTDSNDLAVVTSALATVENAVNGKNKIYRQSTAPSGSLVVGDIWFDTSNGNRQYYWNGTAWVDVQDTAIAAAAAAATAAQTTADGKNKVYRQGTTPTGTFAVGDLWFNTANDNAISRWDGTSWVANTLGNGALASISASKITAGTIDASVITVLNINAGNISTGTLAAARIAAGSLDASKITAGTITASQIATGTITATQIAAGTITASNLATGTLSANNITTGTLSASVALNAVSGTIAGFTLNATTITNGSTMTLYNNGDFYTGGVVSAGGGLYSTAACSFGSTLGVTGQLNANGELYASQAVSTSTSAATNCYITTGGLIRKTTNTSSARYKENITDITSVPGLDPKALLKLPVRAFTYKEGHIPTTDDRYGQMLPGFIAEEVDAIYPIAVDYENGVETWNSFYIIPALLALIQDQEARIKALEGK